MRHNLLFKMVCLLLCVSAIMTLSVAAKSSLVCKFPNDDLLLSYIEETINQYKQYYILHTVRIEDKYIQGKTDSGYNVDFELLLCAELCYKSSTELPHVQSMLNRIGIKAEKISADTLFNILQSGLYDSNIERLVKERLAVINRKNDNNCLLNTYDVKDAVDYTKEEIVQFISELEKLYIGNKNNIHLLLRASFDNSDNLVAVSAVAYDGSAYSINEICPPSEEQMRMNGLSQLESIINSSIMLSQSSNENPKKTEENVVYHRVTARNYANAWTSSPTGGATKDTSKWRIRSNPNATAPFYLANNNDCANYVSQAIFAGGIPKTSNSINDKYHWFASEYGCSIAWESCTNMHFFFTENNYWTASNYANCNAGGIIFLKNSSGDRYHVVMCVQNDTVTRLFSAHTTDKLQEVYTGTSSFGENCDSLEYWVFTNSDTD